MTKSIIKVAHVTCVLYTNSSENMIGLCELRLKFKRKIYFKLIHLKHEILRRKLEMLNYKSYNKTKNEKAK